MGTKLFFGGLAWATTEDSLRRACEPFGAVAEVKIITDRATGRSRGFGFVTFETDEAASKAKQGLDGTVLDGRTIKVDFPRERDTRRSDRRDRRY
jgi:RNA recognition motif-containing protein